jgi:hypothetical protein
MLRHKALIQCARYAFGFGGIVDPDEAERMVDVTPRDNSDLERSLKAAPAANGNGGKLSKMLSESKNVAGFTGVTAAANSAPVVRENRIPEEEPGLFPNEPDPAMTKANEIAKSAQNCADIQELNEVLKRNADHLLAMPEDVRRIVDDTVEIKQFQFRGK